MFTKEREDASGEHSGVQDRQNNSHILNSNMHQKVVWVLFKEQLSEDTATAVTENVIESFLKAKHTLLKYTDQHTDI